jgi:hypothetical protein
VQRRIDEEETHDPQKYLMLWHLQEQTQRDLLEASLRNLLKKRVNPLIECITALDDTVKKKATV